MSLLFSPTPLSVYLSASTHQSSGGFTQLNSLMHVAQHFVVLVPTLSPPLVFHVLVPTFTLTLIIHVLVPTFTHLLVFHVLVATFTPPLSCHVHVPTLTPALVFQLPVTNFTPPLVFNVHVTTFTPPLTCCVLVPTLIPPLVFVTLDIVLQNTLSLDAWLWLILVNVCFSCHGQYEEREAASRVRGDRACSSSTQGLSTETQTFYRDKVVTLENSQFVTCEHLCTSSWEKLLPWWSCDSAS